MYSCSCFSVSQCLSVYVSLVSLHPLVSLCKSASLSSLVLRALSRSVSSGLSLSHSLTPSRVLFHASLLCPCFLHVYNSHNIVSVLLGHPLSLRLRISTERPATKWVCHLSKLKIAAGATRLAAAHTMCCAVSSRYSWNGRRVNILSEKLFCVLREGKEFDVVDFQRFLDFPSCTAVLLISGRQ